MIHKSAAGGALARGRSPAAGVRGVASAAAGDPVAPAARGRMIRGMYKHILAALDGSPRSPHVLRQAAELAARTSATLHLCHAVNVPLGLPADAWTLSGEELHARLVDHGLRSLTQLAEGLDPPVTPLLWGERVCRIGRPAQVIVALADELRADLLVIGSHSLDVLDRLLGTTAARVVNHAHCSVLVVRPPETAAQADATQTAQGQSS